MRQAVLPEMTPQERLSEATATVLPIQIGRGSHIITLLGVLEGEILTYLDDLPGRAHPAATVGALSRELGWTPSMVMMAMGALIRQGLVLARPSNLEVVVESAA